MNLAETELFRGANPEDIAAVQALVVRKDLLAGETLYGPERLPDAIVVIELGGLDLLVQGRDTRLATASSGQMIGQAAYFDRDAARFSAIAREQTRLFSIPFSALDTLLAERPNLARVVYGNAARLFARMLRQMARELERPFF